MCVIVGGLLWVQYQRGSDARNNSAAAVVSPSSYSAVFLSNGQVYFGKVVDNGRQFITLFDIYYLRTQQRLQAPDATESAETNAEMPQSQLTLIKLGESEIHGPADQMEINRDHILYIELSIYI